MAVIAKLAERKLIQCADWFPTAVQYETVMGSEAYGANLGDKSDTDLYAMVIPPKELMFPYLSGKILGFDHFNIFETWQQHHISDGKNQFDISAYAITKYFALCFENNPNMIDSLFTPIDCVRTITQAGQIFRDSRKLFLSKLVFHKFRGYAFSQLNKIKVKVGDAQPSLLDIYKSVETSSRLEKNNQDIDWKFVYHVVRLMLEAEQILNEGDLDLRRNGDFLKSIRQGYMTIPELLFWFGEKEKHLERLYENSVLRAKPDRAEIRKVLIDCITCVYQNFDEIVYVPQNKLDNAISEIRKILGEL